MTRSLPAAAAALMLAACGTGDNPAFSGAALATAPHIDLEGTAHGVVVRNARVQPGDRVLITGPVEDFELLENLAVHVRRIGAHPFLNVYSERLSRRLFDDVPAELDSQRDEWLAAIVELIDVEIVVGLEYSAETLAAMSPERQAARREANAGSRERPRERGQRMVEIGNSLYPTQMRAERYGMSQNELARLFWEGVQADPARLETSIAAVRRVLEGGRTLRVTHPNGTDLTLDITGRPLLQNDGIVPPEGAPERFTWLPAGEVYLAPVAGSGSGRIVLERMLHRGRELRDVTFTFENGRLTAMESPSDISELRAEYDNAPPGRDVLGVVDFGVNPGITSQRVLAWVTSGVVTVMLGDNVWAGGDNNVPFGLALHMPGTTVRVDDRVLIEDGVLRAQ